MLRDGAMTYLQSLSGFESKNQLSLTQRTKHQKLKPEIMIELHIWNTLPETNIAHEIPIFPGKYHQNGGTPMAMLVYRRVSHLDSYHSHP